MKNKQEDRSKKIAIMYIFLGTIFFLVVLLLIDLMWLSGNFLPCYIGGKLVLGNKILRYAIYAFLFYIAYQSGKRVLEGIEYFL